ncbi:DNA polymerase I [Chlorobaculum sp. 24CR]|uniref:DNA polymerase I n=1 Tax=Chlorobaculum sp. 24CR TaxID=2508878 RepID=UPI00100AA2A8|nr:DNA polymerase I [Chlorobaculum sp. 24CR]RXK89150.1 DNA polymerase I [Chlorobaculum sp. 24CR]
MTSDNQIGLFDAPATETQPQPDPVPDKNPDNAIQGGQKPGLFLLDGMAMVYRAFYALQQARMSTRDGAPTGAVFGFVSSLFRIIEEYRPEYLAVTFDSPEKTFRHEKYEAYKANRPAPPDDLISQLGDIRELIRACGIPLVIMPGFEADDLIGTAARKFEESCRVFIVTPDKDMSQLVHDGVRILKPGKKQNEFELVGSAEVASQFGAPPEQFIDLLTLTGDTSDNIPGAKGIGPKTASSLLEKYGSLEGIYANLDKLTPKTRQSLEAFREMMPLVRELVTIRTDLDLPLTLEALHASKPDAEALFALLARLELKSIAARAPAVLRIDAPAATPAASAAIAPAAASADDPGDPPLTPAGEGSEYHLVDSEEAFDALLEKLESSGGFAVDTETTSLDTFEAELAGISFSIKPGEAWFVYFGTPGLDAKTTVARLKPLLENPAIGKTGQNLKYDMLVLKNYGVELQPVEFDTMLASYVLDPEARHNLDDLAALHLGRQTVKYAELVGAGKAAIGIFEVEPQKLSDYGCQDADIALKLRHALEERLEQTPELFDLCRQLEFPLVSVLADMEHEGVSIDTAHLARLAVKVNEELVGLTERIYEATGETFNIDSPKQLGHILFDVLKLPARKATKTGYSTNVQVLEELAMLNPVASDVLEYRSLQKLKGTYIEALPKIINPRTGRLHTSFNQSITATGRLSSSNPNLQNIPIRTALGKEIRRAFIPSNPENLLLSADYSQIELRIAAELSGDPMLIEAFRNREDIHAATARVIFDTAEVTADMRRKAKEVNFGVLYGIQPFGLSQRLGIGQKEAREIIDTYMSKYPGMFSSLQTIIEQARTRGYVTTLMGRRRYVPDLNSPNANIRKAAERVAMNTPIQGTAADIIKQAMCSVSRELKNGSFRSVMLLQVHDELLFETPPDEEALLVEMIERNMVEAAAKCGVKRVPVEVDTGSGKNWLEAH